MAVAKRFRSFCYDIYGYGLVSLPEASQQVLFRTYFAITRFCRYSQHDAG